MRLGRRIAIDVGAVRIGLAISDSECILSTPLKAIRRDDTSIIQIIKVLAEHNPVEIYVGNPLSLRGTITASTTDAIEFATQLAGSTDIPVRLVDERLSTVSASAKLSDAGIAAKNQKSMIDSASAVEILEQAIAIERSTGEIPGLGVD